MSALSPLSGKANYTKIKFLGEGAFGVVKQYKCKSTNELVAIKKIRLKQAKAGINLSAIRELKTLQELDHPHIIRGRLCAQLQYPFSSGLYGDRTRHDHQG